MVRVMDIGGNDGHRALWEYPGCSLTVVDAKYGWDITEKDLPTGKWDVLLVNHLIEHLDDPDQFLRSCKKVMTKLTVLDISTPNLCAWFNRILFLFGWVPHSYELSYEHNLGKPFGWNKEAIGGHLRIFSVRALTQLLEKHGFKVLSVNGDKSTYRCFFLIRWVDRLLSCVPSMASTFRVKCVLD